MRLTDGQLALAHSLSTYLLYVMWSSLDMMVKKSSVQDSQISSGTPNIDEA